MTQNAIETQHLTRVFGTQTAVDSVDVKVDCGTFHGLARETIRQRSDELLNLLSLEQETKKLVLEYSHGMRKKLSLAAALLPNPKLLFLDEPFG